MTKRQRYGDGKFNLSQFTPKPHRRGPYSKKDKEARRIEIHKFHFDYGYSARKIEEITKIRRNTINSDLNYWYSKIVENNNILDPEIAISISLERLEAQYTRLREQYDKADSQQEKNALERLMLDVNSKVINTNHRLAESTIKTMDSVTNRLNDWLEKDRSKIRYMTLFDKIRVSSKAHEKIKMIINEDQKKGDYY
jgi:hypothetical protein